MHAEAIPLTAYQGVAPQRPDRLVESNLVAERGSQLSWQFVCACLQQADWDVVGSQEGTEAQQRCGRWLVFLDLLEGQVPGARHREWIVGWLALSHQLSQPALQQLGIAREIAVKLDIGGS